jgi:hypothetical protein
MAPDQKLVSEDELEALRKEMDEQREEIREALAEDLGGDPKTMMLRNISTTALVNPWLMVAKSVFGFEQLPSMETD